MFSEVTYRHVLAKKGLTSFSVVHGSQLGD